ncbi:hypothetical protein [Terriglobus roseus]|uniref:DUF5666 domain-containing protein n=1 Tax=Terriglobus roseus TaxID=392734 RepID=A0A1G7KNP2_9BACT|nr:hypothetical protein [Terriglobus roseus]SDF38570.1 hypothetical protein SAMN05444167_2245 [Terriglobus roseus]
MKRAIRVACLTAGLMVLGGVLTRSWADDPVKFDLAGPKVDVHVQRGSVTLPIAQVPNLQAGDKLFVKADLPSTQSNHLLLIVAFLRGTTNEPPEDWFHEIDTWDKKTREGTTIVVPEGAEQALMFIAPETGGDFKTLRGAVRGRPGLFIRADAELNEASFEQQRVQRYLDAMKKVDSKDAKVISDQSSKLATTLGLKPNPDCFKQPVSQQVTCLTQGTAPLLLNDGHSMGVTETISSGTAQDLAANASYTPQAGAGLYSAYVGVVMDAIHIVSSLRTAQYQYIPALATPDGTALNLKLNAPVSFINPKSVVVIALPAVQAAKLPPLKVTNTDVVPCLKNPKMVMQIEGAPLVYSTALARDLVLHLNRTGDAMDLPLQADAEQGGLVLAAQSTRRPLDDTSANDAIKLEGKLGSDTDLTITGTITGFWGFDHFQGPTVTLQQVNGKDWKVVGNPQLMAGQDSKLTLTGNGTACVEHIALNPAQGAKDAKDVDVKYEQAKGDGGKPQKNTLALNVSLKNVEPGGYSLGIKQFGDANEERVPLTAYNAEIRLDAIRIHAGDQTAELTGKGLGSVVSLELDGQTFTPTAGSNDATMHLEAKAGVTPKDGEEAKAKLKDGRVLPVKVAASEARPGLTLVSMNATPAQEGGTLPVMLSGKDEIPLHGKLTFVVTTKDAFPSTQKIEVATDKESFKTTLSLAENNLVLQDQHTAIATLDPLKAFGQSAFGPLAIRPITADGTTGDWIRLGVLVRTPEISDVKCTGADAPTCTVDGKNLFLVQTFGAGKDFAKTADVPTGYAQGELAVPTPSDGATLYLKLRDDPNAVAMIKLPSPAHAAASPASAPPAPQLQ